MSKLGVILPGEKMVIAARTGAGKSLMGLQIGHHSAAKGRKVLFITLEMSAIELTQRLMCSIGQVDNSSIRTRTTSSGERRRLIEAANELKDMPLYIMTPGSATISLICGAVRLQAKTTGVDLLIVDYLQRVGGSDPRASKREQLVEITNRLKDLAREIDAPLLELCQLNRASEQSEEPKLSHLAESASIENDADIVLFLHRVNDGTNAIVAKHRHDRIGKVKLTFNAVRTRFEELSVADDPRYTPAFNDFNNR